MGSFFRVPVLPRRTAACDRGGRTHVEQHPEDDHAFFLTRRPVLISPPKDDAESVRLGREVRADPKQCWYNARRAVVKSDPYAGASYVEGWAVTDAGMGIEHGWVVRDGVLVDPTLPSGVVAYFPGLEFPGRQGIADFLATPRGKACRRSPFFFAYGWGGHHSPTFRRAGVDAAEYAAACTNRFPQRP